MTAARSYATYRRAHACLSAAHVAKLRALAAEHGVVRIQQMLRCSQHLFAELRSGGFAMPATVDRIAAALDAIPGGAP